ncbi:MAG: hypothetical protein WC408_04775 [Candidatus Micrarchaeia archaeon]|jgi:hypothetical protein
MPKPSPCPVCGGAPVRYKFFLHPRCDADQKLVVRVRCTKCHLPSENHLREDEVDGFHHELIGKLKKTFIEFTPEKKREILPGWDIIHDPLRDLTYAVRPYLDSKQAVYSAVLRDVNWDNDSNYRIQLDGYSFCDILKKTKKES